MIATGFAGGATGTRVVEALTDESILNDFVRIRDDSRTNTAVLDPTTGVQTEINERGPEVTASELELFREKLLYLAQGAGVCVFSGSLPRGVPAEVYAGLVREVRKLGVTCVVDTEGEPLRQAVRAEPDLVSPNEFEAEELVGHEWGDDDERAMAVAEMCQLGAREAIMTVPDGCFARVVVDGGPRLFRIRAEEQEARAAIGSGDALLAGFVAARYSGRAPEDCLRYAVACGAESIKRLGAGLVDPRAVDRLLGEIEVQRLDLPASVG